MKCILNIFNTEWNLKIERNIGLNNISMIESAATIFIFRYSISRYFVNNTLF